MKTIRDFDLKNKKVLIRCDLNVPIKDGKVLDETRIIESLDTIKYAIDNNAKIIILSHLGRIKEKEDLKKYSLEPVVEILKKYLDTNILFVDETRGINVENEINTLKPREILVLQNTRYEDLEGKKESSNDLELGKYWASLCDLFVNDAFGTCHRKHASNYGIASNIESCIGFLVEKEINALKIVTTDIKRPYTVIMGGAKVEDKINVIDKLIEKADYLLVGGGIANTFLTAKTYDLKESLYDKNSIDYCKKLLEKYSDKIIIPIDGYASLNYEDKKEVYYYELSNVEKGMILDIGPKSIKLFEDYILKSKTIFFNGPVGVSEFSNFEYGTKKILELLDKSSANVIVGGGDSAAAAIRFGYKDKFKHISTGGGATLELIEKGHLPSIDIIG